MLIGTVQFNEFRLREERAAKVGDTAKHAISTAEQTSLQTGYRIRSAVDSHSKPCVGRRAAFRSSSGRQATQTAMLLRFCILTSIARVFIVLWSVVCLMAVITTLLK